MRLIDADTLKKSIKSYADDQYAENEYLGEYAIMDIIDKAPTVSPFTDGILEAYSKISDQEFEHSNGFWIITPKGKKIYFEKKRPQGEWELHGMIYYCSNCGHDCGESGDKFCGNCGAKMKGGSE